jgi:hypothetical protein
LESHPHFHGRRHGIELRCRKNRLFLGGCLPSYFLKQMAQEAVRCLAESFQIEIVNEIVVLSFDGEVRPLGGTRQCSSN